MDSLRINTDTMMEFSLNYELMLSHPFTLQNMTHIVPFNIRDVGNELVRILEKEFRPPAECRLTIDVLIPDMLKGDKDGLCGSILEICRYINPKLAKCSVNIELSKEFYSVDSFTIRIDVKANTNKQDTTKEFLRVHRKDVDAFLARLPYPATFSANGQYVRFSFTMLFFTERNVKAHRKKKSSKKILLVEDDDITALVFISFMEEWEYIVTRVADGTSAVDAAKLHAYDIILMDTFLPKMSGAEAIRKIREWNKKTPIIALTTSPIDKDFTDRYTGANDVLIKPINGADLQRMLKRYL